MSEFQKTMVRLQEMISRSNELVEIKKEAGKIAFQKGLEQGRVEGAIEKLNLVLDKSYFISRTEVSIKQVPTLRVYIKDLIKQLKENKMVGEQK